MQPTFTITLSAKMRQRLQTDQIIADQASLDCCTCVMSKPAPRPVSTREYLSTPMTWPGPMTTLKEAPFCQFVRNTDQNPPIKALSLSLSPPLSLSNHSGRKHKSFPYRNITSCENEFVVQFPVARRPACVAAQWQVAAWCLPGTPHLSAPSMASWQATRWNTVQCLTGTQVKLYF